MLTLQLSITKPLGMPSYYTLMMLHLWTVVPAFVVGTVVLCLRKGTATHRALGSVYMILMLITAIAALFIPARVGPQWLGHFGWIHIFCLVVFFSIPNALIQARRGNIRRHAISMVLLYVGALIIAGAFTFARGRYMHQLFFGA